MSNNFNKMRPTHLSVNYISNSPTKDIDNRWNQIKMMNPFTPRANFAFTSQGNFAYLHGGYNTDQGIISDLYMTDFSEQQHREWKPMDQNGKEQPGKLRNHTLVNHLYYLICVGGQQSILSNSSKIYKYNLKTSNWSTVNIQSKKHSPEQIQNLLMRDSHSCFIRQNKMYVFGGYQIHAGQYANHMLQFDLSKLQKQNIMTVNEISTNGQKPRPRGNSGGCLAENLFYIFGGTNSQDNFKDFWVFDCKDQSWKEIIRKSEKQYWPDDRKGSILGYHEETGNIFMFGGLKKITKQQNDVSIYILSKQKWIKIHSTTNNIYDASPTIKHQIQDSPTILQSKKKKALNKQFQLGIKTVQQDKFMKEHQISSAQYSHNTTKVNFRNGCKTQLSQIQDNTNDDKVKKNFRHRTMNNTTGLNIIKKRSVVQEKKHRQFLVRKKKLLSEITRGYSVLTKRPLSPVSESLKYCINQIGEQQELKNSKDLNNQEQLLSRHIHIPKVIYDINRHMVIGKKPCARDGHAAFVYKQSIYIIGGDRHNVSFNDVYTFRMDKGIQSVSYYFKD